MRWYQPRWWISEARPWYVERPFPWLLIAFCATLIGCAVVLGIWWF